MLSVDKAKIDASDMNFHTVKIIVTDDETAFTNYYNILVRIKFYSYDNPAPTLSGQLENLKVIVDENILLSDAGYPVPVYSYFSKAFATDVDLAPYDTVVIEFLIVDAFPCSCVTLAHITTNDTFKLEIDRSKVTLEDAGLHKIQVLVKDNSTINVNVYQFKVDIAFVEANVVLPTTPDPEPSEPSTPADLEIIIQPVEETVVEEEATPSVVEEEDVEEEAAVP